MMIDNEPETNSQSLNVKLNRKSDINPFLTSPEFTTPTSSTSITLVASPSPSLSSLQFQPTTSSPKIPKVCIITNSRQTAARYFVNLHHTPSLKAAAVVCSEWEVKSGTDKSALKKSEPLSEKNTTLFSLSLRDDFTPSHHNQPDLKVKEKEKENENSKTLQPSISTGSTNGNSNRSNNYILLSTLDDQLTGSVPRYDSLLDIPSHSSFDVIIIANQKHLHEQTIRQICCLVGQTDTRVNDDLFGSSESFVSLFGVSKDKILKREKHLTKLIFCESPVALESNAVYSLFRLCFGLGIELMCGWSLLFDPQINQISTRLADVSSIHLKHYGGEEVLPARVRLSTELESEQLYAGILADDLCAVTHLMGDKFPISIQTTGASTYGRGLTDTLITSLEYQGGISVIIESYLYSLKENIRIATYTKALENGNKLFASSPSIESNTTLTSPIPTESHIHAITNNTSPFNPNTSSNSNSNSITFSSEDNVVRSALRSRGSWSGEQFRNEFTPTRLTRARRQTIKNVTRECNHFVYNYQFDEINSSAIRDIISSPFRAQSPCTMRTQKNLSEESDVDRSISPMSTICFISSPRVCFCCRSIGDIAYPDERLALAHGAELAYLNAIVAGEDVPRISQPMHSYITARLISLAKASCASGRRLFCSPSIRLAIVGRGPFSKMIQERILKQTESCSVVAVISKDSSQMELDSLLARNDVNSVYVATPLNSRSKIIRTALKFKKCVLCEQPVSELLELIKLSRENNQLLATAFHRRFDHQYQRAKDFLYLLGNDLREIGIESKEPLQSADLFEMINKSVVNDVDTLSWLFEEMETEIKLETIKYLAKGNGISLRFSVYLSKYEKTIPAKIAYRRCSKHYEQMVSVNARKFGYNQKANDFFEIYEDAYVSMFDWLSNQLITTNSNSNASLEIYTQNMEKSYHLFLHVVEQINTDVKLHALEKHIELQVLTKDLIVQKKAHKQKQIMSSLVPFKGVSGKGGMSTDGDKVYKPYVYEGSDWNTKKRLKEVFPMLRQFTPKIYGQMVINGISYAIIKNLTSGFFKPKVLDLKIGEPSDFQKLKVQPYGLRVAGHSDSPNLSHGNASRNEIISCFKAFIKDKETDVSRYEAIPHWIKRLKDLQAITKDQTILKFRGASLLFVYDATDSMPQKSNVYLLNMGRTVVNSEPQFDHFFSFGMKNLIAILEEIHKKFVERHAIFLCRHGFRIDYTDLSWVPSSAYPHDPPLSREGIRQAQDLAKRLLSENIDVIVSSPFGRAMMTAKAIAEELNVQYVVEPALAEFMSTHNRRSVPTLDPQFSQDPRIDKKYNKVGKEITLESWESMCQRATEAVTKITNKYKRVAIVSHRSTFQAFLTMITGKKVKDQLQFCSITSILPAPNEVGFMIERMNNYSHINDIVESPEHNPNYAKAVYKDMIVGPDGKILPSGNV